MHPFLDGTVRIFCGHFTETPVLSKINVIAEDGKGRMWFGGHRALWRWDGSVLEDFTNEPVLAGAAFSALSFDLAGHLFLGTIEGRMFHFNGESFRMVGNPADLLGRRISTILPLEDGEIWVSTIGAGLFLRKDDHWHRFGSEAGIPDERLTGLALVADDSFWMGSLGGILRVSRAELLRKVSNDRISPALAGSASPFTSTG